MICTLFLCAEGVIRDAESQLISVYNILEGIHAAGFPTFIQSFSILAILERIDTDPNDYESQIDIFNNDVLITPPTPVAIHFQGRPKNRLVMKIQGLPVQNPGYIRVVLRDGDTVLGTYNIEITPMTPPQVTLATTPQPTG